MNDNVNHPSHYKFANGVEVIDLTEQLDFLRGNAVKYLARAGRKGDEMEDLLKAQFYVDRAITKLGGNTARDEEFVLPESVSVRKIAKVHSCPEIDVDIPRIHITREGGTLCNECWSPVRSVLLEVGP